MKQAKARALEGEVQMLRGWGKEQKEAEIEQVSHGACVEVQASKEQRSLKDDRKDKNIFHT